MYVQNIHEEILPTAIETPCRFAFPIASDSGTRNMYINIMTTNEKIVVPFMFTAP